MKSAVFFVSLLAIISCTGDRPVIQTVTGTIDPGTLGTALPHEHVLVDFVGADSIKPGRYSEQEVFEKVLPYLIELREKGCNAMFECTPEFLGRDPFLLRRLSQASGLLIITNTGYYGAAKEKFFPNYVFTETAEQLSNRWISEYRNGINLSGIRPGFIKLGADTGPLTTAQKKMVMAGALTHLATGLTIGIHSGNGAAAREELAIISSAGVAPNAFIWIHAQNETDSTIFKELAGKGAWVEFDGVNPASAARHIALLKFMKSNGLLSRTLVSHDAGWYHVGTPGGGDFRPYTFLFTDLVPALKRQGFTDDDVNLLLRKNPADAFAIRVRRAE